MKFKAHVMLTITGHFDPEMEADEIEEELWSQLSESGATFDHGGLTGLVVKVDRAAVAHPDPWAAWAANVRAALKATPEKARIINNGEDIVAVSLDYDDDASYARVGDPGVFAKLST